MTHTIWWKVTGNGYPITIDTRGSDMDTVVAVYDGVPSGSTFVTCADDIRSGASPILDTEVFFNSSEGTTYYIQIGCLEGCPAPVGIIDFIAWSSPPGDFREEALPLRPGQQAAGDVRGATIESGENVGCDRLPFSRTVWSSYNAAGSGTATFAAGGTFDTVLAVYRDSTLIGCSDDPSQVTRRVTAGTYHVQVGVVGRAPDAGYGTFNATVSFAGDPPPPPSDRDGDGVIDTRDKCPDASAAARDADRDGCLDPDPDPDRDGVVVPADKCPAQNAGARDKDRDGCLDALPRKRISADASMRATPIGNGIRIRWLRIQAPKGSKVTVRCGRDCRFAKRASASGEPLAEAAKTVTVKKLAGRTFRVGSKIRIYVTRKNRIGAYIQFTVKRNAVPKIKRCLNPGSMKPRKRCR